MTNIEEAKQPTNEQKLGLRNEGIQLIRDAKTDTTRIGWFSTRAQSLTHIARLEYRAGLSTEETVKEIGSILNEALIQEQEYFEGYGDGDLSILSSCLTDLNQREEAKKVAANITNPYSKAKAMSEIVIAIAKSDGVDEALNLLPIIENAHMQDEALTSLEFMRISEDWYTSGRILVEDQEVEDQEEIERFRRARDVSNDEEMKRFIEDDRFSDIARSYFLSRADEAQEKGEDPRSFLDHVIETVNHDYKAEVFGTACELARHGAFNYAINLASTIVQGDAVQCDYRYRIQAEVDIAIEQLKRRLFEDADVSFGRIDEVLEEFRRNNTYFVREFEEKMAEHKEKIYLQYAITKAGEGIFDEAEDWIKKITRQPFLVEEAIAALAVSKAEQGFKLILEAE